MWRFIVMGLFCEVLLLAVGATAEHGARRALLVGINEYRDTRDGEASAVGIRENWQDLRGAVNDVDAIHGLLISRFGFERDAIRVLKNGEASHEAIRSAFREQLIEHTKPGDVCVFYFSGHGRRVRNSLSKELDGFDETFVAADLQSIRDKEIGALFNDVIDRGGVLTAFFDCCHSTSLYRGLPNGARVRSMPPDSSDHRSMESDPRGDPVSRGALVFSACQQHEQAIEVQDAHGTDHGAFTLALASRLRTAPVTEASERLFQSVRAAMRTNSVQEPTLEGLTERRKGPLFSVGEPLSSSSPILAVSRVDGDRVWLQGGTAGGIHPGCELVALKPGADTPTQQSSTLVEALDQRIRVESVEGLSSCTARILGGPHGVIQVGDLFQVVRWATPKHATLRVWIPASHPALSQLQGVADRLRSIAKEANVRWVEDPTEESPTHVVWWDGSSWRLWSPQQDIDLGARPSRALQEYIQMSAAVRLFLNLPPPSEFLTSSASLLRQLPGSVEATTNMGSAHYLLAGRWAQGGPEYAWVLPNASRDGGEAIATPLPVRTDWHRGDCPPESCDAVVGRLAAVAGELANLRAWLELESPPDNGFFPYELHVQDKTTGEIHDEEPLHEGNFYELRLEARYDPNELGCQRRYVYVFALDSFGKRTLLFGESNSENFLPYRDSSGRYPEKIDLPISEIRVTEPFGVDTLFLLTTVEALPDPSILSGSGVRMRGVSPLSELLEQLSSELQLRGASDATYVTPLAWSIQRLTVRSVAQDKETSRPKAEATGTPKVKEGVR